MLHLYFTETGLQEIDNHLMTCEWGCCRYALLCKPTSDEWSDKLRESFLRGHQSFLKLLKMMQVGNFNSKSVSHLGLKET